jgi:hypothetical protein
MLGRKKMIKFLLPAGQKSHTILVLKNIYFRVFKERHKLNSVIYYHSLNVTIMPDPSSVRPGMEIFY